MSFKMNEKSEKEPLDVVFQKNRQAIPSHLVV